MSETAVRSDITPEVINFFREHSQERHETAIHIPGLLVFARNGLLRASAEVHDMDGCHPYTWTRNEEDRVLSVKSLIAGWGWGDAKLGTIQTNKLPLKVNEGFLVSVSFEIEEAEVPEVSEAERDLARHLATGPDFAGMSAEQLVGYENELYVTTAKPFEAPLTIPKLSDYGSAKPVHQTLVRNLSVVGAEDDRKVLLELYSDGRDIELGPVLLDDVTFSIRPIEQTKSWLAWQVAYFAEERFQISEAEKLAAAFNAKEKTDRHIFRTVFDRNLRRGAADEVHVVSGTYRDGQLGELGFMEDDLYSRQTFSADRIVFHPDTKQPFIVDETQGVAMCLKQVQILDRRYA